jgi:hypothetical protein
MATATYSRSPTGKTVNLNTLIPANSGVTLTIANGISSSGVIVGDATINGSGRAHPGQLDRICSSLPFCLGLRG